MRRASLFRFLVTLRHAKKELKFVVIVDDDDIVDAFLLDGQQVGEGRV